MTRAKSSPEAVLGMPVTSRTSAESGCLMDAAISERQYEIKNCNRAAAERKNMRVAISVAPRRGEQAPCGRPETNARRHTPKPAARGNRTPERYRRRIGDPGTYF